MASAFSYIDPEISRQIQGITDQAMQDPGELAEQFKEERGLNRMQGFLRPEKKSPRAYGLSNEDMMEAIDRRALRSYRNAMRGMKNQAEVDAMNQQFSKLTTAAQLTAAELQHNERVRANRQARKENRRRARGAVLGNILGIAGGVVGGVFGGPAGAMAGYSVGQGVGQMGGQGAS